MLNTIQTGSLILQALGDNAYIIRKNGTKVKIPSAAEQKAIVEEAIKTKQAEKSIEFNSKFLKIEEGDTISAGKDSFISINNSYDLGKDKPFDDSEHSASKSITLFPGCEVKISGYEKWSRDEKETDRNFNGEMIKTFEAIKGMFNCSYSHCEDPLITPVAEVIFKGEGGNGTFDLQDGNLYSCPNKSEKSSVLYKCRSNGKTFEAKSEMQEEIIVTKDGIYKKPFLKIDQVFSLENNLSTIMVPSLIAQESIPANAFDQSNYSSIANTMTKGFSGISAMENMTPEDLERLAKMNGKEVTKEELEQLKEMPGMIKKMKSEGIMDKMNKASAMMKAYQEGMGAKGMESMKKMQEKSMKMMGSYNDKSKQKLLTISQSQRNYGELTSEFKVA